VAPTDVKSGYSAGQGKNGRATEMMDSMSMWPSGSLMMLVFAALVIVPFWFIFAKAGFSRWLSLLMVIPVVNLITLYIFAFSAWPNLREKDK
jgi:hypothetical protein